MARVRLPMLVQPLSHYIAVGSSFLPTALRPPPSTAAASTFAAPPPSAPLGRKYLRSPGATSAPAVMAPVSPRPSLGFFFDSSDFSDKTLRLKVVSADSDLPVSRKRRREDLNTDDVTSADDLNTDDVTSADTSADDLNTDDVTSADTGKKSQEAYERRDESTLEENDEPVGITDDRSTDFSRSEREEIEKEGSVAHYVRLQEEGKTDHVGKGLDNVQKTPVLQVKRIRISSLLLASESQFFYKLFTNGMMESNQNVISLQVSEEELEPVQEIINFIYTGEFSKLDPKSLLATLLTADKYEVTRAISECGELLYKSEMTLGTARMYLDFTATNSVVSEALGPVKSAAGDFVALKFKDVVRHEHELLEMPLSVIRCLFMSSELIVPSEHYVYKFLLQWASENYPDPSQSRDVFRNELIHLVRFMHMSLEGLVQFSGCPLMADRTTVMTIIASALRFKANSTDRLIRKRNYGPRVYLTKPVHVSILHPYAEAIAYMDLNLDDCYRMSTPGNSSYINSDVFTFYEHRFFIKVVCRMDPASNAPMALGLFLCTNHLSQPTVNLNVSLAARQRPSGDFVNKFTFNSTFAKGNTFGLVDLFSCPWAQLVGDGSIYVIDGRIHLRVQVKTGAD